MAKLAEWLKDCDMISVVEVSVVFQSDKTRFEAPGAMYVNKFGQQCFYVLANRADLPATLRKADGFNDCGQREAGTHFWYLASYTPNDITFKGREFLHPFGHNMIFNYVPRETFMAITSDRRRDRRIYDVILK